MTPSLPSLTVARAAALMDGRIIVAGAGSLAGASIDTRTLGRGSLFFALPGERTDGHAFVAVAAKAGAGGLVIDQARRAEVERNLASEGAPSIAVISVPDVRRALGRLATAWRRAWGGPVAAITGSNGKTTTKELVAAIARAALGADAVLATQGNLNNELGVPLTLLGLAGSHQVAVVEMGMRASGEIAALATIAEPDVGLITNIGSSHLEKLGSIEAVARAKGELFAWLSIKGTAVVPLDDPLVVERAAIVPPSCRITVACRAPSGPTTEADVVVRDAVARGTAGSRLELTVRGEAIGPIDLPLVGMHNVRNAAAAAGVAIALGFPARAIREGLASARPAHHRSEIITIADRTVLADCYNASPISTRAALETLVSLAKRRVAILGDMLELGPDEARLHAEVGAHAHACGLDLLVCIGPLSRETARGALRAGMSDERVLETEDRQEAARRALAATAPGDAILIKASRALRLEAVVDALQTIAGATSGGAR